MRIKGLSMLAAMLCWCCGTAQCQPGIVNRQKAQARLLLLEMAHIIRLPAGEQRRELPHVYRDLLPKLYQRFYSGSFLDIGKVAERYRATEPETLAAELEHRGGWVAMQEAARTLCMKWLSNYSPDLKPFLLTSLASPNVRERNLALEIAAEACSWEVARHPEIMYSATGGAHQRRRKILLNSSLQVYVKPTLHLYLTDHDPYVASRVRYTLQALESPLVTATLVDYLDRGKIVPGSPEILTYLCESLPPSRRLLHALQSPDAATRRVAAAALVQSGSSLLVPWVPRLTRDTEPAVRFASAVIAAHLSAADWEKLRLTVLLLLNDSASSMRGPVADLLADKEGKNVAPAVLRLMRDETLPMADHFYVYSAMRRIAGEDFGYVNGYFRADDWRPTTPVNRAAIQKFADWIAVNPPAGQ